MAVNRSLRTFGRWNQIGGVACLGVGVVFITSCALGVRSAPEIVEDLSFLISGGLGGLFLLGLGITLVTDRHLEERREQLQRLERNIRAGIVVPPGGLAPSVNLDCASVAQLPSHRPDPSPAAVSRTGA
jgi:hypothetical protein